MQPGDRQKANHTDQKKNASAYPSTGWPEAFACCLRYEKASAGLAIHFSVRGSRWMRAAAMGKVDKKAGTATSSALIFFVNSI